MDDGDDGKKRVLAVDDDPSMRLLIGLYLAKMGYETVEAADGDAALAILEADDALDLVLLDMNMPGRTGLETLAAITHDRSRPHPPVIVVSGDSDKEHVLAAIRLGARDYVVKPFVPAPFLHRVSRWVNSRTEREWDRLDPHVSRVLKVTMEALDTAWRNGEQGAPVDYAPFAEIGDTLADVASSTDTAATLLEAIRRHDGYTFVHSVRTGTYLALFARAMGFDRARTATVAAGGTLHDIGKSRTPLEILNKPGPFDPDEWLVMKEHVTHTIDILRGSADIPADVLEIAWSHHEKLDGTGYPRGLKGDELSPLTRMASIVDAYVALTDRRVYKPAMPPEKALAILADDTNHFDPALVTVFREGVFRKRGDGG
ncbi:MAG: response regulator [Nitrospinae bacterium]|nr:response regulator [Nitrospinota bacterium]